MLVKVVTGQNTYFAAKNMIKQIDIKSGVKHFVLVPDRFSLQVENLIMDELDITSTFNIEVLGISRLALRVLKELGFVGKLISADENLLLTQQAIDNVKDNFKSFKKNSIHFAQEVAKVISQFKSSALMPKDIKPKSDKAATLNKYHDLALIFEEYENLLGDRLDANKLLVMFSNMIEQSDILKNTYLYLVGFDSFTSEMFECISSLAKSCKGLFVALPKAQTRKNGYIYEDDILKKLTKLCQREKITIQVEEKVAQVNDCQNAIIENLFSSNVNPLSEKSYFLPIICNSISQEVLTAGKLINNFVRSGGRYNQVVISCSNLESFLPTINREFNRLDIPYFADISVTADKLILSQDIFKFLRVLASGFSKDALLDYFSCISNQTENTTAILQTITKFNVHGRAKTYKFLSNLAQEHLKMFDNLCSAKTNGEFCIAITKYIDFIHENYQNQLENMQDLAQANINKQNMDIVINALDSIARNRLDYQTSANEFIKTLKLLLSFNQVSTVPSYVDSVMIGDASSSYFVESKLLFVLGGQDLPITIQDNGLVSDDDINSVNFVKVLEPSIKVLNRRNRFKLFNLLSLAKEGLILTYRNMTDDGKKIETPNYIKNLCDIFGEKELRASYIFHRFDEDDDAFIAGLGSRQNALLMLAEENNFTNKQFASLHKILNFDKASLDLKRENLQIDSTKLFFEKNYTKVTQLETYFSCPFKHFVRYGLKLKNDETPEMAKFEVGNICHSMAELFVRENCYKLALLSEEDIVKFINDNLNRIIVEQNLKEKIENLDESELLLAHIKNQCAFILKRICYEQKHSLFKPKYFEKQLEGVSLKIEGGGEIALRGKVDRIDVYDNYFRIIDYKTGKIHPLIKDLFYGDKLQLFIYQSGIEKMLNLSPAGVYYFDCQYEFNDGKEDSILKGLTKNDNQIILASDSKLGVQESSDIINVALKKNKTDEFKGDGICKTSLLNLQEYATRIAGKALNEICSGYIAPKPDENACSACAYKGICLFSQSGRKKSRTYEKDIESALTGGEDGQV